MAYTKLHQEIVTSTIWRESHTTRVLWITMLAVADKNGEVRASIPGLAHLSNITLEECEIGLTAFLAPDKYSRTPAFEGRRIEEMDGGWLILNQPKYRLLCSKEDIKESATIRQSAKRKRDMSRNVTDCHAMSQDVTHGRDIAEAEAEADADSEAINTERKTSAGSPLPPPPVEPKPKPSKPNPSKGPLQLRAEALVNRRPATPATKNELIAFKNSKAAITATPEEEWVLLERFYKLPQDQTFSRHHLAALVNNWNGEIDKARSWFKQNPSSYQSAPKPLTCLPEPAKWREFVASDMPTCPYAPGMPSTAFSWADIPRDHKESLISSMNRSKAGSSAPDA